MTSIGIASLTKRMPAENEEYDNQLHGDQTTTAGYGFEHNRQPGDHDDRRAGTGEQSLYIGQVIF